MMQPEEMPPQEGGGPQELQESIQETMTTLQGLASMKGAPPDAQKAFQTAAQAFEQGLAILTSGGQQEAPPQEAPARAPAMGSGKEQFVG